MSFLFELYGVARNQKPRDDKPLRLESESKRAFEDVLKGQGPIKYKSQLVSLLDPVRELDWASEVAEEPKSDQKRSAALLHCRGESITPCSQCNKKGPWNTCVVFPVYNGKSVYSRACSNCIYKHKGKYCSHRLSFEAQGGQDWDPAVKGSIVPSTDLRSVPAKEPEKPVVVGKSTTAPILSKKRKLDTEYTEAQMWTMATPKKPRIARSQAKSAFDGERLPWPVSPTSWNDPEKMRSATRDLESFVYTAKKRVASLEADRERMSLVEYWNQEAAKLFP